MKTENYDDIIIGGGKCVVLLRGSVTAIRLSRASRLLLVLPLSGSMLCTSRFSAS